MKILLPLACLVVVSFVSFMFGKDYGSTRPECPSVEGRSVAYSVLNTDRTTLCMYIPHVGYLAKRTRLVR